MLAGLLSSEVVGSLFNSCPWEVHCFVAYCVAGELMRGEPICFLFSVCLSCAFSHFLPLSFLLFFPQSLFVTSFTSYVVFFFPHRFTLSFYRSEAFSQKYKKCIQNLHRNHPQLALFLCNGNMEMKNPPPTISPQINQSDL